MRVRKYTQAARNLAGIVKTCYALGYDIEFIGQERYKIIGKYGTHIRSVRASDASISRLFGAISERAQIYNEPGSKWGELAEVVNAAIRHGDKIYMDRDTMISVNLLSGEMTGFIRFAPFPAIPEYIPEWDDIPE